VKDLVAHLVIGPANNQVGLAVLDNKVNRRFNLDSHQNLPQLMQALDGLRFNQGISSMTATDVIDFLTKQLDPYKNHYGRASYKNSVVIIADHTASPNANHHHHSNKGHAELSSVTVINVGGTSATGLSQLATDSNHVIDVHDYASLKNSLSQVLQLICS
jgi:hypothetical protein